MKPKLPEEIHIGIINISGRNVVVIFLVFMLVLILGVYAVLNSYTVESKSTFNATSTASLTLPKMTLDCMSCHTSGTVSFKAVSTIDRTTCNACHREDTDLPLVDIVHKYHLGNISNLPKLDYVERHSDIILSCDSCHIFRTDTSPECKKCHQGNDHVSSTDKPCVSCHGYLTELFKHNTVQLKTHDIFGNASCTVMCHSEDKFSLQLFNGAIIFISDPIKLCKQCHSTTAKTHFSDVICVDCHNPHDPKNISENATKLAKILTEEKAKIPTPTETPTGVVMQTPMYPIEVP
jgi:hypothetical protein